ncbi:MAG TPA: immunity 53 family protein [Thermoanaerobaculia bacterium]|nr:immunity 53 family protein [Thermoanaerobaculia bacterium]
MTHENIIQRLQAWFQAQCDGEWEHQKGVSIRSCDNPGWWVKIDISGTRLEGKYFAVIRQGDLSTSDPQPPCLHCYVEENVFNGVGDATMLEKALETFLAWAEATLS